MEVNQDKAKDQAYSAAVEEIQIPVVVQREAPAVVKAAGVVLELDEKVKKELENEKCQKNMN